MLTVLALLSYNIHWIIHVLVCLSTVIILGRILTFVMSDPDDIDKSFIIFLCLLIGTTVGALALLIPIIIVFVVLLKKLIFWEFDLDKETLKRFFKIR